MFWPGFYCCSLAYAANALHMQSYLGSDRKITARRRNKRNHYNANPQKAIPYISYFSAKKKHSWLKASINFELKTIPNVFVESLKPVNLRDFWADLVELGILNGFRSTSRAAHYVIKTGMRPLVLHPSSGMKMEYLVEWKPLHPRKLDRDVLKKWKRHKNYSCFGRSWKERNRRCIWLNREGLRARSLVLSPSEYSRSSLKSDLTGHLNGSSLLSSMARLDSIKKS